MSIHLRATAADLTSSLRRPRIAGIAEGSYVLTNEGPKPIERLQMGEEIVTVQGTLVELRALTRHRLKAIAPLTVKAGTFGQSKPAMDTMLAPGQHIMLRGWRAEALFGADAALVPAWRVADGSFVAEGPAQAVTLFELHFETEAMITVNGLEIGSGIAVDQLVERVA